MYVSLRLTPYIGSLNDPQELTRLAIHDAKHCIILSWRLPNSDLPDSGILSLTRIIQDTFKSAKFTVYLPALL
ncbi:MAG: hypothetical protein P4M11_15345 [Candidatus Pacebacteria bacterium]|nr:hypothetical protein [Candidatus Paceibacterota bacterium]